MKAHRHILLALLLLSATVCVRGQKFFNLTAEEVRIGETLPVFTYSKDLGANYQDSTWQVSIEYPEFVDMTSSDIEKYTLVTKELLPTLPKVTQNVVVERKRGRLEVSFVPLVFRNGKYQILASFMLKVKSKAVKSSTRRILTRAAADATERYASHSVLASGRWAKIRVPESGVFRLTNALIRQAGFTNLSKVKIYGYGGALQPEQMTADYIKSTDDLQEVPTYVSADGKLFYAQGPVSWTAGSNGRYNRTRNYCSDYGYYFLTESEDTPLTVDSTTFVSSFYPSADFFCSLYEQDSYAWYEGGRNLYDSHAISEGGSYTFDVSAQRTSKTQTAVPGILTVSVTGDAKGNVQVILNDSVVGTATLSARTSYDRASNTTRRYNVKNILAANKVTIKNTSVGGTVRIDYISIKTSEDYAAEEPRLSQSGTFPVPEYVYNITNQDHHADTAADMIIVIPTTQTWLDQAQRLAALHEQYDSMRVRIVPADELFNEYSSGTPDPNAYRRYLKMLYDRAENDADMPSYLLLFGDCMWDNRFRLFDSSIYSPDDYLLCFESENSMNDLYCVVDDGFFTLLDDGEGYYASGSSYSYTDKADMAVGRLPVHSSVEAKAVVDKTIAYRLNSDAGAWQNYVMFMGDDGNNTSTSGLGYEGNIHMEDADNAAKVVESMDSAYYVKRVMWDAYERVTSSTGNTYPEATKIIKQQNVSGALIMDYSGHGAAHQMSHENVLRLSDFEGFTNTHLPLWVTASCDIMPFDGSASSIGEAAVLNSKGGAIAFFGTTRTVYRAENARINQAFLRQVLDVSSGRKVTFGEAQMRAKNYLVTSGLDNSQNKLQYALLGDPALTLNLPLQRVVVDSINRETPSSDRMVSLRTGEVVTVHGHVERDSQVDTSFSGLVTAVVRDSKNLVTCRRNDSNLKEAYQFYDRTKVLYNGSDSVRNGRFSFTFAVPQDINYSGETGMINLFAVDSRTNSTAHGSEGRFTVSGGDAVSNDSIGPSIYCYLNSTSFVDGGNVNSTPYFMAEITDKDGINASGNGIGHDLQLVIDGEMQKTYVLNDYFSYDFGSYTKGSVGYALPELSLGTHTLKFRAWDILNNSSTATLTFNVVEGLSPSLFGVSASNNPARESTTFILTHDRSGSDVDVRIEVFDMSGRLLWQHDESGTSGVGAYTVNWDLTTDSGAKLQTGVYLYRASISSDGSRMSSKAKKLIII